MLKTSLIPSLLSSANAQLSVEKYHMLIQKHLSFFFKLPLLLMGQRRCCLCHLIQLYIACINMKSIEGEFVMVRILKMCFVYSHDWVSVSFSQHTWHSKNVFYSTINEWVACFFFYAVSGSHQHLSPSLQRFNFYFFSSLGFAEMLYPMYRWSEAENKF